MENALAALTHPLSEAETQVFLTKLWQLLVKQAEHYTMGDSTSLPVETAQELFKSICYTLQFEMIQSGTTPHDLLERNMYDFLRSGQTHLAAKLAEVKKLWKLAHAQEKGDVDSLKWIGCYLRKYDLYYFAHQTPWDMGYPVFSKASGQLLGISSAEAYLMEQMEYFRP